MKTCLYLLLGVFFIISCSKKNGISLPDTPGIVRKDAGLIPFKAIPLADNQLKISFSKDREKVLTAVLLKQDTTTLATAIITDDGNGGSVSAVFTYSFQPGITYNFAVDAYSSTGDASYRYTVRDYVHRYVKSLTYQKVLALHQSLGPNVFDISPSRDYLFIGDYVDNKTQLKRLSFQTLGVEDVSTVINLNGSPIRALSDHELLVYANKNTNVANLPAVADAGNDAVVLCRYDLTSQKSVFVDYVSSGYGRVSRIINNHVLVTNPIFTAKTASLINLGDLSKIQYPLNSFDFTAINTYSFNHIVYNNTIVNTTNGSTFTPINLNSNSGLIEVDDATGYIVTTSGRTDTASHILFAYSIYRNGDLVYQSDYEYGRSFCFPIIYNIKNDIVTFYQYYGYDTKVNIDGYYTLNLKTKEVRLIQDDSTPYVISDYQLTDGSMFSIRTDGVYKLRPI